MKTYQPSWCAAHLLPSRACGCDQGYPWEFRPTSLPDWWTRGNLCGPTIPTVSVYATARVVWDSGFADPVFIGRNGPSSPRPAPFEFVDEVETSQLRADIRAALELIEKDTRRAP